MWCIIWNDFTHPGEGGFPSFLLFTPAWGGAAALPIVSYDTTKVQSCTNSGIHEMLSGNMHLASTTYTFVTLRNHNTVFSPLRQRSHLLPKRQVSATDPLLKLLTGGKGENLPISYWDKYTIVLYGVSLLLPNWNKIGVLAFLKIITKSLFIANLKQFKMCNRGKCIQIESLSHDTVSCNGYPHLVWETLAQCRIFHWG